MRELFATVVYLLCFATSATCALLLIRSFRRSGTRLLLWSGLCFLFLALNNLVVVLDLLVLSSWDMRLVRHLLALAGIATLLYGFVWKVEEE